MAAQSSNVNGGKGGKVRLVSLNIGGNSSTFGGMDRYLCGQDKADVILLQEVKAQQQILIDICIARGYCAKVSCDNVSGLGIAIIWRKEIPLVDYEIIQEGRIQLLDLGFGPIVNVYGPAGKLSQKDRRQEPRRTISADNWS